MKRFIMLAVVCAILAAVSSIAVAEDYSSMSDDELYSVLNSVRTILYERDLALEPDQVLMENELVKMYLDESKDVEFSNSGFLKIPVILVNNTENVISFQVNSVNVNGWDCGGSIGNVDTMGKKRETLDINCTGAEITSIDEIEDVRISFLAFNMDTRNRELETEPIIIMVKDGIITRG